MNSGDLDRLLDLAIDVDEAFALTAALVRHRSYPGEEEDVQAAIVEWLHEHGLPSEIQMAAEHRPNVIARIENGPGPTFMLNGHVDTVLADPRWKIDPWQGRRDGDRFYGLGAADMKSGVAAAMLATRFLGQHYGLWRGTLVFTSVVDEEAYSIGAHTLIESGLRADYCVVTESSFDRPCLGAFGKYLVRVDVTGKAAHASWPEQGINAAVEAARFVAALDHVEMPGHPRIRSSQCVLSSLSGSPQYVITVPEHATVLVNRHSVPGETEESVITSYAAVAGKLDSPANFAFSIDPPRYPSWETPLTEPLVVAFAGAYAREVGHRPEYAYSGYGDPNLFSTVAGMPTVMFGPRGGRFHEAGEWTDLSSILSATRVLIRLACDLLRA